MAIIKVVIELTKGVMIRVIKSLCRSTMKFQQVYFDFMGAGLENTEAENFDIKFCSNFGVF